MTTRIERTATDLQRTFSLIDKVWDQPDSSSGRTTSKSSNLETSEPATVAELLRKATVQFHGNSGTE